MTQEEKQLLLLVDLYSRMPHGVKISKVVEDYISEPKTPKSINTDGCIIIENEPFDDGTPDLDYWDISEIKPYLRPMSSMTLGEECEFCRLFECDCVNTMYGYISWVVGGSCDSYDFDIAFSKLAEVIDWLNAHHFDYRGLIKKGLAIEAPEDMYKSNFDMFLERHGYYVNGNKLIKK